MDLPIALLLCKDPIKVSFFKKAFRNRYRVLAFEEDDEALTALSSTSPSLMFIDFDTLNKPLTYFCHLIRQSSNQEESPLPLFLICRIIKKAFILEALEAGITDFIHEPLQAEELYERVAVYFHSSPLQKRVSRATQRVKTPPLIARNTQTFARRTLIRDQTLRIILQTQRQASPLGVLTLQLDSFPKLSRVLKEHDLHRLIQSLDSLLSSSLRPQDTLITEGPGHYLILLPKTSSGASQIIAKEIQKEVSSTPLLAPDFDLLVTLSVGVLSFGKELSGSAKAMEQLEFCLERVRGSLVRTHKKGHMVIAFPHEE